MSTIIVSNVLLRATIQTEAENEKSCMYGGVGMSKLVNACMWKLVPFIIMAIKFISSFKKNLRT